MSKVRTPFTNEIHSDSIMKGHLWSLEEHRLYENLNMIFEPLICIKINGFLMCTFDL